MVYLSHLVFGGWGFWMTLGWLGCVATEAFAQKDSVQLETVTVKGFVPERFMSGLKLQRIDSASLAPFRFQNISEALLAQTPLALKQYGPGQLNTVSFRGTSANHTAVLWNGLNINSPTLGQTDFSTIPVAGFDQLSVQYGPAASVVGSDAVGGSILLGSKAQPGGLYVLAGREQSSLGNSQSQLLAGYGTTFREGRTLSFKTAVYDGDMQNRYQRSGRQGYAYLPSQTKQRGLVQDVFFVPKTGQELSAHIWLTHNALTIAPDNPEGRELTETGSSRAMLRYNLAGWTMRAAWTRDVLDYATGDYSNLDHALTNRYSGRVDKSFRFDYGQRGSSISVLAGGEWALYRAYVAGYDQGAITENRQDIFLLTRWQVRPRLVVSLNVRQAFVTGYNPPLTPSLGGEYLLARSWMGEWKARASVSRSYRVPTLNERYWKTLGNANIRPENGTNFEAGVEWRKTMDMHALSASLAGYHNRVRDWTYWNPARNYFVENLQQVLAKGIEWQAGWDYRKLRWNGGLKGSYAWTRSEQERVYDAYAKDVIGKQLVYVPEHNANLYAFAGYKQFKLTVVASGYSRRYNTFDNSTWLNGYGMAHVYAEASFAWGRARLRLQGQINNVTNTFYLNVRNNAMPGRTFAVNLLAGYAER